MRFATFIIAWLIAAQCGAAVIKATDLTFAEVSNRVASASAGDVVLLPKLTNTWPTEQLSVTKRIYITGRGQDRTRLNRTTGSSRFFLYSAFTGGATNLYGVSHMAFNGGPTTFGQVGLGISAGYPATSSNYMYRIHHVTFDGITNRGMYIAGLNQGVVDHCLFKTYNNIAAQGYTTQGTQRDGFLNNCSLACQTYLNTIQFGTITNYAYVEDCVWDWAGDGDGALDGYGDAYFCIRFNKFTNSNYMAVHEAGMGRAGTAWEFYGNEATGTGPGLGFDNLSHLRSGVGHACSNTLTTIGYTMNNPAPRLTFYRSSGINVFAVYYSFSTVVTPPVPADTGTSLTVTAGEGARFAHTLPISGVIVWGAGTNPPSGSVESMTITARATDTFTITRGSPARTILAGDHIMWFIANATGTNRLDGNINTNLNEFGYPGLDQPGYGDPSVATATNITQTFYGTYFKDNLYHGTNVPVFVQYFAPNTNNAGLTGADGITDIPNPPDMIQENRDYFNQTLRPGWTPAPYPHPYITVLGITPTTPATTTGSSIDFGGTAGSGSYLFFEVDPNETGAIIDESTGVYVAGPIAGTDTVRILDSHGNWAETTVTVSSSGSSRPFPRRRKL